MMSSKFLIFGLLLLFVGCKESAYSPDGLTKLTEEQLIERAKNKDFPTLKTIVYKNEKGEVISTDSVQRIPQTGEWTADWYADEHGVLKEFVLRRATEEDRILQQKVQEAFNAETPIELVAVDCVDQANILQKTYESDQGMRADGGEISIDTDRKNLATIIGLIEKCGMPTLATVNQTQMDAIWVVLQHGNNPNRKKYLPLLEAAVENGDLRPTQIAMMKDRILMYDGKPQIYGSQISQREGEWVLYRLRNPETVNQRRAAIGFEPLEDYLQKWNIEFTVQQTE